MHYNEMSAEEKVSATKKALKENDREMLDQIMETKLEIFQNADKIAAFDFEFAEINGKKEIIEVGIAFYDRSKGRSIFQNSSTIGKHFVIKGMKELMNRPSTPKAHTDMFAYGTSKEVSLEEALKQLASAGEHADVMLSFTPIDRKKFLKQNDMAGFRFLNVNQLLKIENGTIHNPSLSGTIEEYCKSVEQPINNAGNDAMSTLEIMSNVFGERINFKYFESRAISDFSNDPRKVSGADIQLARAEVKAKSKKKRKSKLLP